MAVLSWASVLLISALTVAGCVDPYLGAPYSAPYAPNYGGGYYYAPAPQNPYATPWVGPNTPWVYYQGDWFLNGMLYNYYGNRYGWAPYYAYPPTYIVRPNNWYEPKWNAWYQQHPEYWQTFNRNYPYWRDHHSGQRYDQDFYNRYHRGQGEGWQRGFQGRTTERPKYEGPGQGRIAPSPGQRPGPAQVTPREGPRPGGPAQISPREGQRPGPARLAPPEGQSPGPARITPYQGSRPGPAQVTPREGPRPGGPAQVSPREGQRPGPAQVAPSQGQRPGPAQATPHEGPKPGGAGQVTPREGQRPGPGRATPPEGQRTGPAQ